MKDKILEILTNSSKKLNCYEIQEALKASDVNSVIECLNKLENEYLVYKTKSNKYMLFSRNAYFRIGNLAMNKKGYGFVLSENEEQKDIYVNGNDLNNATDGDRVLISVDPINNSGKVIKILKRDLEGLVGEIYFESKKAYLKLDDEKKNIRIIVKGDKVKDVVEGTKVKVKIDKIKKGKTFIAEIEKIIGHKNDPHVDVLSIALKYGFDNTFPEEVIKQVTEIENEVSEKELQGRTDLTDKIIFTIDGDDTKDIDDAISIEKKGDNYILGVHIADVSNYVTENSPLDIEAYNRGTSAYLADSVIPMLPHKLSNGICSLNPGVIRLAESCVMEINSKGEVVSHTIFPSYIKSRIQMTYKKVNNILKNNIVAEGYEPFVDKLKEMEELAKILRQNKINRGYLAFDIPEAKAICDENGKCIDIIKRTQDVGECLIEDFMIAANECVASHIYNLNLPSIYRVHDKPNPEKLMDFVNFAIPFGFKLNDNLENITPRSIQSILKDIELFDNAEILSEVLLRSMKKAVYSKDNIGHFGLGSKCYTHFTSPIRRYPDLIVHRLVRKYIFNNDRNVAGLEEKLGSDAENSSLREQASIEAEREVLDMKMAEYMESHIGEEYDGMISGVTNFGMFVQLPNLIEGLVHVSTLDDDYYSNDEKTKRMVGKDKGKSYGLGDKVRVKVISASKTSGEIDFKIV